MATEGAIVVGLTVEGGRVAGVTLHSSRQDVSRAMFVGRTPEEVVATIGTVFSLCGIAQTIAARQAVEDAMGAPPDPSALAARDLCRGAEMVTQSLLRLCLHWPGALALQPVTGPVKAAMTLQTTLEKAFRGALTGEGVSLSDAETQEISGMMRDVRAECETLTGPGGLFQHITDRIQANGWQGFGKLAPGVLPEQGALTRRWGEPGVASVIENHGAGLLARFRACVMDVQHLLDALERNWTHGPHAVEAAPITAQNGTGEARVETVRGTLCHRVEISEGRVVEYDIQAPTEANFAPGGVVETGLVGESAASLETTARLHVLAVDPCVDFTIEVTHA